MDFFDLIMITIQITTTIARRYASSSDESIENLVYYKDCQHKNKISTVQPQILREPAPQVARQPDCPFPKMCCALSCGNDCNGNINGQSFSNMQMEQQSVQPQIRAHPPFQPLQPQLPKNRRKRIKVPMKMQPIPSRRDLGYTKDKIKSLIAHDNDIKKILKDLVTVTMQKVDLVELIHNSDGVDIPNDPTFSAEDN